MVTDQPISAVDAAGMDGNGIQGMNGMNGVAIPRRFRRIAR